MFSAIIYCTHFLADKVVCNNFLDFIRPVEYNINKSYISEVSILEYITASRAAEKWHISQRRVQILCAQGRIAGVFKLGENWAIPEETEKPKDTRRKRTNEDDEG